MTGHLSAQVIWSEQTEEEETKRAGALFNPLCGPTHSLKVFNLFLTAWFLGCYHFFFCKEAKKGAGAPLPHPYKFSFGPVLEVVLSGSCIFANG